MANGTDSEEYVVLSRIRPGLKREFAFAMKSQSEYAGSVGRTRASRSLNAQENSSSKKLKSEDSKERENEDHKSPPGEKIVAETGANLVSHEDELKSDVVVVLNDDEPKCNYVEPVEPMRSELGDEFVNNEGGEKDEVEPTCNQEMETVSEGIGENGLVKRLTRSATKPKAKVDVKNEEGGGGHVRVNDKLELKMSKKVGLKRFPTKLKELLDTGLLEGIPVKYLRSVKERDQPETGLQGVIKGSGILCYCDNCNGAQVVTPTQFELHAGSASKRPPEYIYLDNGNTLRDVLNACKNASLEELESAIQNVIGLAKNQPTFCLNCKGSISQAGNGKLMLLCDSCVALKESQSSSTQLSDKSDRSSLSVSAPNSSARGTHCSSTRSKGHGRLTRKDLRMHKLVFEEDVLPDGTELAYFARGQKLLEGYKKGFAIYCFCCQTEVSPSQFEAHAGWASRRKPYLHIYTSNGVSLHELSIRLAAEKKFSADENDDLCTICGDGGKLLLCDNCPRAFHPDCVSLPDVPQDTWYCKHCQNMFQKEKFVERNVNALAAGRVAGVDPIEQITNRCIRIVSTQESEPVCVLCSAHDYTDKVFGPRTVIICDQCEKEYHVGCMKEHNIADLKELPDYDWFCCMDCNRIHSALQELVKSGEAMLPSCLLEAIKTKQEQKGTDVSAELDIRWRLLFGKMNSDENRELLSKAVDIFHNQFDPIADSSTGRLDLIPQMVFGREMKKIGKDFGGMYCAILTVNSTVVSAGIIRIFGKEVAELPLVATRTDYQGQGYFQSLFSCIERLLRSLDVHSLVLPAADEAESIWTKKFGFKKMTKDELKHYRKFHQMLIFEGTSMLHKPVTMSKSSVDEGVPG